MWDRFLDFIYHYLNEKHHFYEEDFLNEPGKPLNVFGQLKVIDFNEIDGDHTDFHLHTYLKLIWKDPRLKRKDILTNDCSAYVWTPDVMFERAKSIQKHTKSDNIKTDFRIEPTGLVVMINRYSFQVECRMNFRNYPFDQQQCQFTICFGTRDDVAVLKWIDEMSSPRLPAIELSNDIYPIHYRLGRPLTPRITKRGTYGNYTCLLAYFPLVRRLTGPVLTTYIPTALVVAISWFPFWLKPDDAPARVTLSITSLLTLCTQVQQYKSYMPRVSYITAMDIWLFACICVVFSTLLEFVLCYKAYTDGKERENKRALDEIAQTKSMPSSEATEIKSWAEGGKDATNLRSRIRSIFVSMKKKCLCSFPQIDSVKMDMFCRAFFPLSFLVFTIIYLRCFMYIR